MPKFFFTDANGVKRGPLSTGQLRELAARGIITPITPLETDSGHEGLAGQISGLFNAPQPVPAPNIVSVPAAKRNYVPLLVAIIGILTILGVGGTIVWKIVTEPPVKVPKVPIGQVKIEEPDGETVDVNVIVKVPVDEPLPPNPDGEPEPFDEPNPFGAPQNVTAPVAVEPAAVYVDGHDFFDGVAWMRTRKGVWHCVDKTGKVVLRLGERETPQSSFSHGVALVERSDNTVELIDKSGKIISSPKQADYDEIRGFIRDVGMTLVYRHVETFQLSEDQAGVIDSNGNWQVRLSNNPTLVYANRIYEPDKISGRSQPGDILQGKYEIKRYTNAFTYQSSDLYYCGEGVLVHRSSRGDNTLFSVLTGNDWKLPGSLKSIGNGYVIYESERTIYSIDKSGKTKAIIKNLGPAYRYNTSLGDYADGLFYFSARADGQDAIPHGFYDISGKRVIDLSQYNLRSTSTRYTDGLVFSNGYCALNLFNPQRVGYYTVIDKSGKIMFEPRQSPQRRRAFYDTIEYIDVTMRCGMVVIRENEYGTAWTVINAPGDVVAEFGDGYTISDYCEDVALVKGKGEIYYIDKTGKRLF